MNALPMITWPMELWNYGIMVLWEEEQDWLCESMLAQPNKKAKKKHIIIFIEKAQTIDAYIGLNQKHVKGLFGCCCRWAYIYMCMFKASGKTRRKEFRVHGMHIQKYI